MDANGKNGFSLVELSIVLVILGLLTGGILGGQSLIHAAELRAVTTEYQQWQTAVNTFKQKYFAIPGDFDKAEDFWTAAVTADGNGDGRIYPENTSAQRETFLFWQHLALAGLVTGEYTGVTEGSGTDHIAPGVNAPTSKYGGATWTAATRLSGNGTSDRFLYDYVNTLMFGAPTTSSLAFDSVLTPEDAWNIDTKLDDGKPGKGSIIALYYSVCATATDEEQYDADYRLNNADTDCALYFNNGI